MLLIITAREFYRRCDEKFIRLIAFKVKKFLAI